MAKRTPTAPAANPAPRVDGWANVLTGIGMAQRDKRMGAVPIVDVYSRTDLEAIWRGDDLAARIVELPPGEMLRQGYSLSLQFGDTAAPVKLDAAGDVAPPERHVPQPIEGSDQRDREAAERLADKLEELGVNDRLFDALCYERAFGGAGVLVGANDGATDLREPLRLDSIRSVDWLTTLASHELLPVAWYNDPRAPRFGEPSVYRIQTDVIAGGPSGNVDVHESRLLIFGGVRVSRRQVVENRGWGDSVLVRCARVLADYHQTWGAVTTLLQDFSQAVFRIKDLADLVATNQESVVVERARLIDMTRSVVRAVLLDADESFTREVTPLGGMPEMLDKLALRLSAAADMPVTLLMGQAPAGLNATGASDVRFFYDRIKARQETRLRPALERLLRMVLRSSNGPTRGIEPPKWSLRFAPLWQLTEVEEATRRLSIAQADAVYLANGVVTPEEIAASRFGGDEYSTTTRLDRDARLAMAETTDPTNAPTDTGAVQPDGQTGASPDAQTPASVQPVASGDAPTP